jgi:hypothetical protein
MPKSVEPWLVTAHLPDLALLEHAGLACQLDRASLPGASCSATTTGIPSALGSERWGRAPEHQYEHTDSESQSARTSMAAIKCNW